MSEIAIPGYEIMELLGKGGMASVYKARHINLDREVALKIMDESLNADQSFSERFVREAKISAKLMHPNIIQVYDVGHINKHNFLSMEYICGGDLAGIIHNDLDLKLVHQCIGEMALALDFSHSKGVIHRDIKPSNILIRENGSFALADFGIARREDSKTNMTIAGSVMGTPKYMSPEQAMGDELDGRSDLYSLGVVFYEMLTKKVPYEASSSVGTAIKHLNDAIPLLPKKLERYQQFLNTAMAKKPENRHASGLAMYDALQALAGEDHQDTVVYSRTELNRALNKRQMAEQPKIVNISAFVSLTREKLTACAGKCIDLIVKCYAGLKGKAARFPVKQAGEYGARLMEAGSMFLRRLSLRGKKFYAQCQQAPAFSRVKNILPVVVAALFVLWILLLPFIGEQENQVKAQFAQQQLFIQAEQALSHLQYAQAAGIFAEILQRDGTNVRARQGLDNSIEEMTGQVSRLIASHQVVKAKALLQALSAIDGNHPQLAAFTRQVNALEKQVQGQQATREEIRTLMAQINSGLTPEKISVGQVENLLARQLQLASLQPKSQEVQTLKAVIFHKAIDSGKLYLQQQDIEQTKQLLAIARKLLPDHPSVRSLNAAIDAYGDNSAVAQEKRALKARQVERYLAQAENAFGQKNYYAEAGLSAYFLYVVVLELQPDNAVAIKGMNDTVAAIEQQAIDAINRSDITSARQAVYRLSRVAKAQERVIDANNALLAKVTQSGSKPVAQAQLTALLAQGESDLQHYPLNLNRLTSALNAYRKVLLQQPFEGQALEGYRRLSELFLTFAQERSAGGNYPVVLTALEQAITLNPDNPLAINLFNQIQDEIAKKEKLLTSKQLLAKAEAAGEKALWLDAVLAYARLLQLLPTHEKAKDGYVQVKAELFNLLSTDIKRNRLTLTRQKMATLSPYLEEDPGFIKLYQDLEFAQAQWDEKQARRRASIPDKIQKARALVKSGNLTLPWNNSAHYYYQQVLAIDPQNVQAKKGLDRIYKQLVSMADGYLNQGELKKARVFYNRLAKLAPSRPELAVLKSKMALLEKSSNN
ncbi:serine/threonine-protein kinase [Thalassomonas haliotis]|uniref:Serine/threonine protein kinase n=1 Tax=Thalassomonas haliotis TaxID=485448 RepID=A0ABY7VLL5_9GAMM|nr:serine/threonine-protein kinase [Thalassomonas haliotis]WDE14139.1 serine/threonine protein kinase [Thalassomonas haliotis]